MFYVNADRLKRLERRGLVSKTRDPKDARGFIYKPMEQAIALIPMLVEMIACSARDSGSATAAGFLERFENEREALIAHLTRQARSAAE